MYQYKSLKGRSIYHAPSVADLAPNSIGGFSDVFHLLLLNWILFDLKAPKFSIYYTLPEEAILK